MNLRFTGVCALVLALTACKHFSFNNYIADQNKQYLNAQAAAPLQIPTALNNPGLQDQQHPIAAVPSSNHAPIAPSLLPPGSLSAQIQSGQVPASVLKQPIPAPT